jgi:hypothetical protein
MAQVFRTWCRETYRQGGTLAVLRLWPHAFSDLAATALAERLEEGISMSRLAWIRLGNIAIAVASVALIVQALLSVANEFYVDVFTPSDAAWQAERAVFYATSYGSMAAPVIALLYILGLVGLRLRLGERAGPIALLGCVAGCVALTLFLAASVGPTLGLGGVKLLCVSARDCNAYDPNHMYAIYGTLEAVGVLLLSGGMMLLGATAWRTTAGRRNGGILLFLGAWTLTPYVLVVLFTLLAPHPDGSASLKFAGVSAGLLIIWAVGWLLLLRQPQPAAAHTEQLDQSQPALG